MKKIAVLLFLILLLSSASAEATNCLHWKSIALGDSVEEVLRLLKQNDIEYEIHRFSDPDDVSIFCAMEAFGCKDSYSSSNLYFDAENGLKHITPPLPNANSFAEMYEALSKYLGNADIISFPDYVDYDVGESYVEYSYPAYVVWVKKDAIYELEIDTSIYTTVQSRFLEGIEIEATDSPDQDIEMTIYPPDSLEDISHRYY